MFRATLTVCHVYANVVNHSQLCDKGVQRPPGMFTCLYGVHAVYLRSFTIRYEAGLGQLGEPDALTQAGGGSDGPDGRVVLGTSRSIMDGPP